MRRTMRIETLCRIFLMVLIFFCCSKKNSADEDQTVTPGSDSAVALKSTEDIGLSIYKNKCTACHGNDGAAGIAGATNLQTSQLTEEGIQHTISNGRGRMPSFRANISESEIKYVAAYVRNLKNK
jgi:mono/diheme cytochrome c family protein